MRAPPPLGGSGVAALQPCFLKLPKTLQLDAVTFPTCWTEFFWASLRLTNQRYSIGWLYHWALHCANACLSVSARHLEWDHRTRTRRRSCCSWQFDTSCAALRPNWLCVFLSLSNGFLFVPCVHPSGRCHFPVGLLEWRLPCEKVHCKKKKKRTGSMREKKGSDIWQ